MLYKAYTVECAGISTALLKFCVVVACQLHPLGDSRITVAEHPHIELHVTVKDVLNPSILNIEIQADVGKKFYLCSTTGVVRKKVMTTMRKLPIGIQSFENIRNENYLYVDKTALIYQLVTKGKPYFLSRPQIGRASCRERV